MLIIPQHLQWTVYFYLCYNIVSQATQDSFPSHAPSAISIPAQPHRSSLIHLIVKVYYPDTEMQVLRCN